jgi:hypothetical protein
MSLLELRKNFLAVLLVSFMALGMAACSSTGDSSSDDSASGGSPTDEGVDCSLFPSDIDKQECEAAQSLGN